jgi:alkanesulfonate monooxygenase SsuD/methylene tetrahydromethanopterin reductase-like flavin-dependent oxidoreductase (luciferase family)
MFVNVKPSEEMKADLDRYRSAWRDAHGPDSEPPQPLVSAVVFVDENAGRALELANKYARASYHCAIDHYGMTDPDFGTVKGYEHYKQMRVAAGTEFDQAPDHFAKKVFYGTPEQVLERFEVLKRDLDMQGLFVLFHGTPHQDGERNLGCFVQHCLPELKRWPAMSSLGEGLAVV